MAPPLRRPWPASFPVLPCAGLLAGGVVAGYAAVVLVPGALDALRLVPADVAAHPWTPFTYAFVHGSVTPLLVTLVALLLVAPRLEARAGARRVLGYFAAGSGVGAVLSLAQPGAAMAGAGPAVVGLIVGFVRHCPDEPILPPLQLKGRWAAAGLAVAALLPGLPDGWTTGQQSLAAGALAGMILLLARPPKVVPVRTVEQPNSHFDIPGIQRPEVTTPWDSIDLDALHEVNRSAVEGLLLRARELGPGHLSAADRELLDRMKAAARG